jgi:ADP-ribose pyrophosphatase
MIPKKAKRVFKGIIFDVYHWKEKMFDGTYTTFEGIKRRPTVQLIVIVGDKLLLQKEEQPMFGKFISLPGGVVNENETPINASKRELLEEEGMKASKIKFWRKTEFLKRIEWNTDYFIMKDCKKISKQNLDNGERIEPVLVSFDKFVEIVSKEEFRNKDFSNYIFRLKQDKKKLEEFRKIIFH